MITIYSVQFQLGRTPGYGGHSVLLHRVSCIIVYVQLRYNNVYD